MINKLCLTVVAVFTFGLAASLTAGDFTATKPVTKYKKGRYQKVFNEAKPKVIVKEVKGKKEYADNKKTYDSPKQLSKYNKYYMETVHAQKGRVYMLRNHKPINQDANFKPHYCNNFRPSNMDMNFGSVYTRQHRLKNKLAKDKK